MKIKKSFNRTSMLQDLPAFSYRYVPNEYDNKIQQKEGTRDEHDIHTVNRGVFCFPRKEHGNEKGKLNFKKHSKRILNQFQLQEAVSKQLITIFTSISPTTILRLTSVPPHPIKET
jgi:hypothetical protein